MKPNLNYKNETPNINYLLSGEVLSELQNNFKEQEILGSIYLTNNPDTLPNLMEVGLLPEHFYDTTLGRLYEEAIDKYLDNGTPQLSDVPEEILEMYHLQDLSYNLPLDNAKEVMKLAKKRKVMGAILQGAILLKDNDTTDIYPYLETALEEDTSKEKTIQQISFDELQEITKSVKGIPTGIDKLDRAGVKFNNGQLTAIGADTGAGKTTFLLNIITNQIKLENKVLFFSLEETAIDIVYKMLALLTGFSKEEIQTTKDSMKLEIIKNEHLRIQRNLFIECKDGMTISQLKTRAKNLHRRHNFTLIGVDYWQMLQGNTDTAIERYISTADGLLNLAIFLNVPVIALAQVDKNSSRMTTLDRNAFSGSKQLSNNAYYVMMLQMEKDTKETTLEIVKSRHPKHYGLTAPLKINDDTQRFIDTTY
jgi:replicative DNA helicase